MDKGFLNLFDKLIFSGADTFDILLEKYYPVRQGIGDFKKTALPWMRHAAEKTEQAFSSCIHPSCIFI